MRVCVTMLVVLRAVMASLCLPQICLRVDRESQESKVSDLMLEVDGAQEEMNHRYKINQNKMVASLSMKMDFLKNISFLLAVAINLIIMLSHGVDIPTIDLAAENADVNATMPYQT